MNGIILVNKPAGMTSFSAVARCRRIFHEKKVGHSGTLDPNASGVLLVFLGRYTKLIPYCVKDHKYYHAHFKLGQKTDTQDIWGEVIEEKPFASHSQQELNEACEKFTGEIEQIPPMYSALKKDGKKLYEYARKGIEVERQPRKITVNSISVKQISEDTYQMDAVVSSGTYIRTLIEDYCASLNELGTMTFLERRAIENLSIEDAVSLDEIDENTPLLEPYKMIEPSWKIVQTDRADDIRNGKRIRCSETEEKVIFACGNDLLAAYEKREDGLFHCVRGLF